MDLFYYGSQDVPPLPGDSPRPAGRLTEPAVCESCSAPVPPAELAEGRAAERFGLVLCPACRRSPRAEERISLYFCDRCHVSVPVYRVDTGEAVAGDGRILCVACRRQPRRRRSGALLAGAALLCLAGGVAAGLAARGDREAAPPPVRTAEWLSRLERAVEALTPLSSAEADSVAVAELALGLDDLARRSAEAGACLSEARESLLRIRAEMVLRKDRFGGAAGDLLGKVDELLEAAEAAR